MDLVTRYVELGLRLGRHDEGFVDAYFGPPELKERVEAEEPRSAAALLADADELLERVAEESLDLRRRAWLEDQLRAVRTWARLAAGEPVPYAEEVETCFGVRAERTPESQFEAVHARLDVLLPAGGPLVDRFEAWRATQFVPSDLVLPAFDAIADVLRHATRRRYGLPEGEDVETRIARDESWLAYNWYLGGLRSRIEVNVDLPITAPELVEIVAHETYPGHHTEHAWKEALLVSEGVLEEALVLLPTPQSMVSEAIAETALDAVADAEITAALGRRLRDLGLDVDLAFARRVRDARRPLRYAGLNVAMLVHEDGVSDGEAVAYAERWEAVSEEYARATVRFVRDPFGRAYVATYAIGGDLARRHVAGDDARYRRLLAQHVRVADLLSVSSAA